MGGNSKKRIVLARREKLAMQLFGFKNLPIGIDKNFL